MGAQGGLLVGQPDDTGTEVAHIPSRGIDLLPLGLFDHHHHTVPP